MSIKVSRVAVRRTLWATNEGLFLTVDDAKLPAHLTGQRMIGREVETVNTVQRADWTPEGLRIRRKTWNTIDGDIHAEAIEGATCIL